MAKKPCSFKHLFSVAQQAGIPTDETAFTLSGLFEADEAIMHSSGTFCNQIAEIDGKRAGGKSPELLKKLQDAVVAQFEEYTYANLRIARRATNHHLNIIEPAAKTPQVFYFGRADT